MFPWWIYALIAAAIVGLGLLIWWWIRRHRKPVVAKPIDPFVRAAGEFDRIEKLGLVDAGERGRYVTLMIEVVRDYLAARYAAEATLSLTSTELQRATMHLPFVPQDRLTRLLTEADLIKFARRAVSGDRAREIGREARAIVETENKASQPTPEQAKAQPAQGAAA
jgi:DNA-directed RNA polymerase subunit K/omega